MQTLRLPRGANVRAQRLEGELGHIVTLTAEGRRLAGEALYADAPPDGAAVQATAVPYYLWNNRGAGSMQVWVAEGG